MVEDLSLAGGEHKGTSDERKEAEAGDALGEASLDATTGATSTRRRLRAFVEPECEVVGALLPDFPRHVVKGAFTVTPTGTSNANSSSCSTEATGTGLVESLRAATVAT
ncbi:hypothetical_protein [Leishmania infantum]|uniref:Uncharacterized protein n=2 Tax=Leishmania donovani species complex TaxID=38574 RepID=A0A3S7X6M2_LEIDO|nr:hypothetical protein LdCL_330020900 [Leishmania donovani]CAC9531849.1 hypothetical_protein [Leishmania infantum]SUZ45149.1 hypothetical_protein [Leishmania infantum]